MSASGGVARQSFEDCGRDLPTSRPWACPSPLMRYFGEVDAAVDPPQ